MIKIEKPRIEKKLSTDSNQGWAKLVSNVVDDQNPLNEDLWFSTTENNSHFFCDEVCDAFVVAMLLPAVKSQQDIECDCISEKLLYNLNCSVSYLLQKAWGGRRIKIIAKNVYNRNFVGGGVGTGCSLGVDSFSTILAHSSENATPGYRITHLTYFNVGAFGSRNPKQAEKSYQNDLTKVKVFASEYGLPLITIESNLGITNKDSSFDQTVVFRNAAATLSMQKLFSKYYNGSTVTASDTRISRDSYTYESILNPMLSTESTELILADPDKTRVDKTRFIAENSYVKKHLLVCWKEIFKNEWPQYWDIIKDVADKKRNCSRCDKCMRTCIALDYLGYIDDYSEIFDLPEYYRNKNRYLMKIVQKRKSDVFCADMYNLIIEKGAKIPMAIWISVFFMNIKSSIGRAVYKILSIKKTAKGTKSIILG